MKICIIKLGAEGDVLRTIPIAKALKNKYKDSKITWITKPGIAELLENIQEIDEIATLPYKSKDSFDKLYNFDLDKEAVELAKNINSKEKYGFTDADGYPSTFNLNAEYYLNTTYDDELKKSNKKTYQEMMLEVAELPYNKEKYHIILKDDEKQYAQEFISKHKLHGKKIIGIHMGASSRWPSKVWHSDRIKKFIKSAKNEGFEILLFGGPNEAEYHKELVLNLEKDGLNIHKNDPKNTKKQFASLVEICDVLVCSDSFALHVSIGLGKKTIGLFFCTSPKEIEDYGLLKKIISKMLDNFFPEHMDKYNEDLVKSITEEQVLSAIKEVLDNKKA